MSLLTSIKSLLRIHTKTSNHIPKLKSATPGMPEEIKMQLIKSFENELKEHEMSVSYYEKLFHIYFEKAQAARYMIEKLKEEQK